LDNEKNSNKRDRRGRDRMVVGCYNYLCSQCLPPLMLWVRIPLMARCTTLCDKVCQWLAAGWWFSPVLRFPPPIKLTATI